MSRIESADVVVGTGSTTIAAGAYKDAEEKTRYKFGIRLEIPSKSDMGDLVDKIYNVGLHRIMSVKAAGTFNKANDFGTKEDAEAFSTQFSTVAGWAEAFEKARREGAGAPKIDSVETATFNKVATMIKARYEGGTLADIKVPLVGTDNPPLDVKGRINFKAWARLNKEHPWYSVAYKLVSSEKGFD